MDRVSVPFGIRQVRFDSNTGLFINGKHVDVHGVGYHQDREGKGWARDTEEVAADEAMMREMGVTGIRLTHYQHGQPIHDFADHDGLVVWDEMPLVSQWTLGTSMEATPALRENARQLGERHVRWFWICSGVCDEGRPARSVVLMLRCSFRQSRPSCGRRYAWAAVALQKLSFRRYAHRVSRTKDASMSPAEFSRYARTLQAKAERLPGDARLRPRTTDGSGEAPGHDVD